LKTENPLVCVKNVSELSDWLAGNA